MSIAATASLTHLPLCQWPTIHRLHEVVGFGGRLTFVSLLNTVRASVPELLLGKLRSLTEAGLMSRAQGLVSMFQQLVLDAVNTVALPYFASEMRAGNALGVPFIRAAELVVGLGWAFFGVLALLAFPVVRVLYGLHWDDAVLPVRWLALASAMALPGVVCYAPLVAVGALGEVIRGSTAAAVLGTAAAAIAANHGVTAVAQWQVLAGAIASVYWLWLAQRRIDISWRDLAASTARSAVLAIAAMTVPFGTVLLLGWRPLGNPLIMLSCVPLAALMLVLAARITRHALWIEVENALPVVGRRLHWRS